MNLQVLDVRTQLPRKLRKYGLREFSVLREYGLREFSVLREYGLREFSVRAIRWLLLHRYWYDSAFDKRYGVSTSMILCADELDFHDSQAQGHAQEHNPSSPYKVMAALKVLKKYMGGYGALSFVDYGCGAGRAMIVAAEAGFQNIVGIELSPKLIRICKENIATYSRVNRAAKLAVLVQDAATYLPGKHCGVFFFYVPFSLEIYKQAIANIALSLQKNPRTIYVLDFAWSKIDFRDYGYECIARIEGINLYKTPD
ncbi:MAG: class I SAM-dependent methyltransferase [Gammaproteobacteria bacterium]|jgi:SAM-dependent methyltransferase